jgi:hypothetical protein
LATPPLPPPAVPFRLRLALLTLALAGAGCAGGAPTGAGADGTLRFSSDPVPLQVELGREALGGRRNLAVRATASCRGPGCTPDRVELSFTNDGPTPIQGDFRALRIEADDQARLWEHIDFGGPDARSLPTGQFLRVEVEPGFFLAMARAEETHVVLGTTLFRLVPSRRATFRRMAEAMGAPPP